MAAVDANAAALGVPRKQLMESSGNALARVVREYTEPGDRVATVAGRGNNGGDAFVAARFLEDRDVTTILLGRPDAIATDIARENWAALQQAEHDARVVRDSSSFDDDSIASVLEAADVVIDAMVGTGVHGALREPAATAVERIDGTDVTVVSVDVPSGVDADTGEADGASVTADHVVTFHEAKPGLEELDATVTVADIGIPEAAELFVGPGDLAGIERDPDAHKGDHGHVLVVGGGPYTGAPALAAQSAFRGGADLVTVACPESVADVVRGYAEELIVEALPGDRLQPGHVDRILELHAERDATVFGPGLGRDDPTMDAAEEFLASAGGRIVVDADPLRVVPDVDSDADLLCTPHAGELAAMGGPKAESWRERADAIASFAPEVEATILAKGAYDVITDGTETRVSRTGNPGMTAGGTGDVLAGLCGAFVCLFEPVRAGSLAAYVNGLAGDAAAEERGDGLIASDLIDEIPAVVWGEDGD